jgi:hypothetical protein
VLSEENSRKSLTLWDYPEIDFYSTLQKAVFGTLND